MQIKVDWPPNIKQIEQVFPIKKGVIFTWGQCIYNPDDIVIGRPLMAHESVHMVQQNSQPQIWWDRYLVDKDFRFKQELEAHQSEYREFCRLSRGREKRVKFLFLIAVRLQSPLYGSMCTIAEARKSIKAYKKHG